MNWFKNLFRDREFEQYCADEKAFNEGSSDARVIIRMRQNTEAVLKELKVIRWFIILIFFVVIATASKIAPDWWKLN